MARRRPASLGFKQKDIASWNFIIFLTLAFILLVIVLTATNRVAMDVRSRAAGSCAQLVAPRAEDCPGGWTFKRDTTGCLAFFCEAKPSTQKSTKK